MTTDVTAARALFETMLQTVWVQRRFEKARAFFTPDAPIEGFLDTVICGADYGATAEQINTVIRLVAFDILDFFEGSDGRIAVRLKATLEAVRLNRQAPCDIAVFATIQQGKIAAYAVTTDDVSFMERVGMIRPGFREAIYIGGDIN